MYPPTNDQNRYSDMTGRSSGDINFENAVRYRQNRMNAQLQNPSMPIVNVDPGWDVFWGGMERAKQNADDQGLNFRVDYSGLGQPSGGTRRMPTASQSLGDRAGVEDPVTAYQLGRAELNRRLEENQGLREQNRMQALTDALATDPGMIAAHASDAARQAETDARAAGRIGATAFEAGEPTRRAELRERVQGARELAPYSPQALAGAARLREIQAQDETKSAIAERNARAREITGAESAYARSAGASMPADPARSAAATDALRSRAFPGAPPVAGATPSGPADAGRVFDAALLGRFAQEQGLTEDQARQYISSHGYTIR